MDARIDPEGLLSRNMGDISGGVENVGRSLTNRLGGGRARHPDIRHGPVVSGFVVPRYRNPSRRAMLPRSPLDPPVVQDSDGTGGR